jgi:phenylacetyl-CoA:acceptor oxidoreductase subunit 2
MSYGPASFGANPWQQKSWDWRAAANFICGGGGAGLIVVTVLLAEPGMARSASLLIGLALVCAGLFCVWLEIGRPLRALHVFLHPRRSWMTREAFAATLLVPATVAAAADVPAVEWIAAALALVFVYCQGRMLRAAKGIPAWREPRVVPLIVGTGLAEGAGLFLLVAAIGGRADTAAWAACAALVAARIVLWQLWRRRLADIAPRAQAALDRAGLLLLLAGCALPLAALALAAALTAPAGDPLYMAAGALAFAGGAQFKFVLLGRASFNQGFALAHLPVRGTRR